MPKYRYIVVNEENKQLNGTISTPDEQSARQELNELGFSVISINELNEEENTAKKDEEMPIFEFGAIDKNQKHVAGTIQAEDRYAAYKRLVNEYSFDVEYIVDSKLPDANKFKEKQKGIYDLQDKLNEELFLTQKKTTTDEKELQ